MLLRSTEHFGNQPETLAVAIRDKLRLYLWTVTNVSALSNRWKQSVVYEHKAQGIVSGLKESLILLAVCFHGSKAEIETERDFASCRLAFSLFSSSSLSSNSSFTFYLFTLRMFKSASSRFGLFVKIFHD